MIRTQYPAAGLVDAHVHIADAAGLADAATAGVTALRDAGTQAGAGLALRGSGSSQVISAGWAIFRTGGYGSRFGAAVETRDDIRREIRKLVDAGAGIIKVMASGIVSLTTPGAVTPGGFSGEDLSFLAAEARGQGLNVMAHANGAGAISDAISAGVRSVEHGFFMTGELLKRMADQGVVWIPTFGALARAADAAALTPGPASVIDDLLRSHLAMIREAHAIGVPLAVGTDCVLPDPRYGERYQRELRFFEEAGLTPETIERIACVNGRQLLER